MIQKNYMQTLMAMALAVLVTSAFGVVGVSMTSGKTDADLLVDFEDTEEDLPILPINARKLALRNGEGVGDILPRLFQMSLETRKIDESQLPHKCGVILFYHIPGTDGTAINQWLKKLKDANNASYFSSMDSSTKESFIGGVDQQIGKTEPNDWKIIYAHDNSISLVTDENILRSWRDAVEKRGCHFIATTVFQDPMNHSVNHTKKKFAECQCEMDYFKTKLDDILSENPWRGQLDYLLFNDGATSAIDTRDKVKMGMQLLKHHFDLVLLDNHDKYSETILKVTGWSSPEDIEGKVLSDGNLVFSKELIGKFGKLASKNGDSDFIDAVSHVYHNSLGYLMMQY